MEVIDSFSGEYAFLSNFHPSPITFFHPQAGECRAATVEHAYQSLKTSDNIEIQQVLMCETPGRAKRMGQKVTIRKHWEEVKVINMGILVRLKFLQNPELGENLLATGDLILIEGNHWHDNFFGYCTCSRCKREEHAENHLGRILSQVRRELRDA